MNVGNVRHAKSGGMHQEMQGNEGQEGSYLQ